MMVAVVVLVSVVVGLNLETGAQSECTRSGRVINAAEVFDRPPTFSTQAGWQAGSRVATLAVESVIRICQTITVGFIGGRKTWYQIQYDNARGWVFAGTISTSIVETPVPRVGQSLSLGLIAIAVASADTGVPSGVPHQIQFYVFYGLLFLVTLLGMGGKVVSDEMEALPETRSIGDGLRACLSVRRWMKAAIVAPIVFLAFLQMGKATLPETPDVAALIGFCLAFQNGFFWQTVIPGSVRR